MDSPTVPEQTRAPGSIAVPWIATRSAARGAPPLAMVTAYDEPSARIADGGGVDMILVGDSVANNVLGYEDTLQVTIDDMVRHIGAVARARTAALVVADMPWMSYHLGAEGAVANAALLVRAGAGAVKLEGGAERARIVEEIVGAQIPVMGHIGLTPQSVHVMGGYRVQAKDAASARALVASAVALESAGCFAIVLEGIPDVVAAAVTARLSIPTVGIGAGGSCDGQVLVFHDLLGLGAGPPPKFVRQYARLADLATSAIARYVADVRSGDFPGDEETYHATGELTRSWAPDACEAPE